MDKYLKGTTTLGFVCKDGVVLASDSRATMGHFISDKDAQKIYSIEDKIAMTTAGLVGDNQALVRIMRAELALYKMQGKAITVKSAATLLANILHGRRMFPYWVQLLVGGLDSEGTVYEIDAVGGMGKKKVASTGSGSPTAYGVLETEYREGLTIEEGVKLAIKSVKAALERDSATGNHIEVATITDKGYAKLSRDKVKSIINELKPAK